MTSTETTNPTEVPAAVPGDHRVMYATDKMTYQQSFAGIHGAREGLLMYEQLPPIPDRDEDVPAWRIAVQKVLEETGSLASYRASLVAGAFAAYCPPWCLIKHAEVGTGRGLAIGHEAPLVLLTFDGADTENRGVRLELTLACYQDEPTVTSAPFMDVKGMPELLSAGDAAEVAQAFVLAADRMRFML
ncbi:MAG: DUF6907 domain-containing protein, partial [Mycobacteriales bacterium]